MDHLTAYIGKYYISTIDTFVPILASLTPDLHETVVQLLAYRRYETMIFAEDSKQALNQFVCADKQESVEYHKAMIKKYTLMWIETALGLNGEEEQEMGL